MTGDMEGWKQGGDEHWGVQGARGREPEQGGAKAWRFQNQRRAGEGDRGAGWDLGIVMAKRKEHSLGDLSKGKKDKQTAQKGRAGLTHHNPRGKFGGGDSDPTPLERAPKSLLPAGAQAVQGPGSPKPATRPGHAGRPVTAHTRPPRPGTSGREERRADADGADAPPGEARAPGPAKRSSRSPQPAPRPRQQGLGGPEPTRRAGALAGGTCPSRQHRRPAPPRPDPAITHLSRAAARAPAGASLVPAPPPACRPPH